ncbi:hypothetical protein J6590_093125 [Homalodisca vitripennis]|nr:hypothetical protein J6590_036626 [Homalodisca vitripennis]KAG8334321.1 hypothetical protein J6590_093125 [Homalodisca vitripennis]
MPEVYAGNDFGLLNSSPSDCWFGSHGVEDIPYLSPSSPDLVVGRKYACAFLADVLVTNPTSTSIFWQ